MSQIWVDHSGTLHEQYQCLVLLGQDFAGDFSFDPGEHPALRYRRTGFAYFCPHCGDIWARIVLVDSLGRQRHFQTEQVACEKHSDQWNTPGSLIIRGLEGLVDILPLPILSREFMLYVKELENE